MSASYWETDWKWAMQQLARFAESDNDLVLWAVATGLGFIAAFNGDIDIEKAERIIGRLKNHPNPSVVNAAQEAQADIEHFVERRQMGEDVSLAERLPENWRPPRGHFPGQGTPE